jgi:hypothetical protein
MKVSNFKIREPYWSKNAVGLDQSKMTEDILSVDISYKDKAGNKMYPETLYIAKGLALHFPTYVVRTGYKSVILRLVPLDALKEKSRFSVR